MKVISKAEGILTRTVSLMASSAYFQEHWRAVPRALKCDYDSFMTLERKIEILEKESWQDRRSLSFRGNQLIYYNCASQQSDLV